jgi:thiosulfate/3-mercaptopyruvate sulfurtransferase
MTDPLVSTAWLADNLLNRDVQIVDATWYMPGEGVGRDSYQAGHIPGAVFFDVEALSDPDTALPHMLPSPEAFAQAAGRLGLRREATIVAYDAQGIFSAPRAWWTLRVMGFGDVRVLDGGLKAWRAEGLPIETVEPVPVPTELAPAYDAALVRDLNSVRTALSEASAQVIDARAAPRFRGEAPEPRPGLKSGHMPGARNLPWSGLVTPEGTLEGPEPLRAALEAAGVDLSRPIITTCGSGVSAATLALGLARLGRDDVAVYDGSWTEWAGRSDTVVVTGP